MAYDLQLADRIRKYLKQLPSIEIEEKEMFKGVTFMVNGKMCINVSGNNLMCRFDPAITETIKSRKGFQPMVMKDKIYKGYCYVEPVGFKAEKDFDYWIKICLDFNSKAKASGKRKT